MNLTSIDIIFLIIIGGLSVRGLFKGVIKEAFSLGSLIIGLLVSMAFYMSLSNFFTAKFGFYQWSEGVSFFLIFLVVFVVMKIAEHSIVKLVDETSALSIDRSLGFVLGLIEGIIISSLVAYLIDFQTLFNSNIILENSFIVPYLRKIFPFLESAGTAVIKRINK